jgi:hypothetical protein
MCSGFIYFDVETDIALASKKEFTAQLSVNIIRNQAIMEFGALQCVPKVRIVVFVF